MFSALEVCYENALYKFTLDININIDIDIDIDIGGVAAWAGVGLSHSAAQCLQP